MKKERLALEHPLQVFYFEKLCLCFYGFFLYFGNFRIRFFIHFVENEVCENHGADTGGEFTDDNGNEIFRIEGNGKCEMARKYERARNGERHIENNAFFIHLFYHADRGYVGSKAGNQTHGGNIVDADQLTEEDQRFFQNFGKYVNERECACHDHASVNDGSHAFVIEGSHAGEQDDSCQLGEDTERKTERNENLNAFTENGEYFYASVRRECKTERDQSGEDDQGNEIAREIGKAHFQNESGDQTADGNGDDTAKHTESHVLVVLFINDTERERNSERYRCAEHGSNDETVEISRSGVTRNLFRKRSATHIVGKKRTHNDGRFQKQIFFQRVEYGHDPTCDHGSKNDHTDHGECHRAEKHNALFHLFANAEAVAEDTVKCGKDHETSEYPVEYG